MKLEIVTKEDLQNFKKELLIELSDIIQKQNIKNQPRELYKTYEVMKMLNISKGTLQTFRTNGTLPFTKLGKCIYFKYADIMKLAEANTIQNPNGLGRGHNRFSIKK
jgi:hypothetical protein